jgi:hypothetical protein
MYSLPRKLATLLLVALTVSVLLSSAARAEDDRQEQNRRDRIKQREEWTRQDIEAAKQHEFYAAIAYSPSTSNYGYSYKYETLADAQREALRQCKAKDAETVAWARNGWYCALAVGKDGYGHGSGKTAAAARAMALRECRKQTTDCKIVVCVYSGS